MIIIHNKKVRVYTYFDRNTDENVDFYRLDITNRTTNDKYTWDELEDLSTMKNYYDFRIPFSGVTNGEYEYILSYQENNKTKIADKGLLVVGEYEGLDKASYTSTRVYECYDPLKK
jgi:hypothetical protein